MNVGLLEKPNQCNIVGLDWYTEKSENGTAIYPTLAICYENGYVQLMHSANDQSNVLITEILCTRV